MAIKLLDNSVKFEVFSQFDGGIDGHSETGEAAFTKYTSSLDKADLVLNEGVEPPTPFIIRCLTSKEQSDLHTKHYSVDTVTKKVTFVHGYTDYLLDCFNLACLGVKTPAGITQKVTSDEVGMTNAMSVGALIANATLLGKNLKNV